MNQSQSSFYVIGLSHKKADVSTRSSFSLSKENQKLLLQEAKSSDISSVIILSTCNRIEIIGFAQHPYQLISLLCKYSKGTVDQFAKVSYVHKGRDAVGHFIKIATGLDSQILGDYEIVGQLKDAFQQAKEAGTINAYIERLYNLALQASKEVKNKTTLSSGTTTVSYAAIQYIQENLKQVTPRNVLVYGVGNIGKSTAKSCVVYLKNDQVKITNRDDAKAYKLADELGVKAELHEDLTNQIKVSDVIIVATGASVPTVTLDQFDADKKQLIIDLSVPRNVDSQINSLENKTVIDVDVLSKITQKTIENRKQQIPLVENIIAKYKKEFIDWLVFRKSTPAITALKNSLEIIQKDALTLHLKKHQDLNTEHAEEISSLIVNKIVTKFATHLKDEQTQANHSIQVMEQVFK